MLKLVQSTAPVWIVPKEGVRLCVRPLSRGGWAFAVRAARAQLVKPPVEGAALQLDESEAAIVRSGEAFTIAAAQFCITEWEGVGDADGAPVPPSAETISQLLAQDADVYDAFEAAVVVPAMERNLAGNGSAPSPSGSSAKARTSADIAPPAAKRARRTSTRHKASLKS